MNLLHMVTEYYVPQLLHAVAMLGIADHLAAGPQSVADLAAQTQTHAPSLERILRALASVGIFAEDANGQWTLTPLAEGLQTNVPGSQRAWVQLYGGIQQRAWFDLLYSIQTGKAAFPYVFGEPYYNYMANNSEAASLMDTAMDQSVDIWLSALTTALPWDDIDTVADVGGGHGNLLVRLLTAHPHLHGHLFDLPHVVAGAPAILTQAQIGERCSVEAGDMFVALPEHQDVYILSRVLLNWDDEHCAVILRNCHRVLSDRARLVIVDAVSPEGPLASGVALWDVFQLVIFGARVRRQRDFEMLLQAAQLKLIAIHPTPSQFSILEVRQSTISIAR